MSIHTFSGLIYAVQQIELEDGTSLFVPEAEMVRTTYQQLLEKEPGLAFPYWARIWPSALALVRFLKEEPHWVKDKRVLELGAGIGLPSFSIAAVAEELVISDKDPDAVVLLQKNIQHLGLPKAKAIQFDWNQWSAISETDTVLMSDVNYDPAAFPALLETIQSLLTQGITIVLSTPQRLLAVPFAQAIAPWVVKSQTVSLLQSGETRVSVFVLTLANPHK